MLNEIDLSRTDLNLLVLFEAVMEERHVGRAADRLNLTASAVSHGLGRLRRLLGDPLFLRTPRGVAPTDRALALAAPVAEVLAQARSLLASVRPFDPATSRRRFRIGAPDAASAVFLPPLLTMLAARAPGIDIAVRQILPAPGEPSPERAWRDVFPDLDDRIIEIAVLPTPAIPARFQARILYDEDFIIVARRGHPFAAAPGLDAYCRMEHLVVSLTGDPQGFVDDALAENGRSRRVALTVSNFMSALAIVAETDLIAAVPRRFALRYADRFGVAVHAPPLPLPGSPLRAVAPKVAMMDAGIAWLFGVLGAACATEPGTSAQPH